MGKNTMIRKAIRTNLSKLPQLDALLPHIKGNVGFVFVPASGELSTIKKKIAEMRVEAPARAGAVAPCDVIVKAGPTGMEPTQTFFLQALNIASKIVKGQVEIISDVNLIKKGDKVLPGQAPPGQAEHQAVHLRSGAHRGVRRGAVYTPDLLDFDD